MKNILTLILLSAFLAAALAGCVGSPDSTGTGDDDAPDAEARARPFVVVATLDTGVNPLHPTWQRPDLTHHPSEYIPGYPVDAEAIHVTLGENFQSSIDLSETNLSKFQEGNWPYWIPGTNIIGTWADHEDQNPIFDVAAARRGEGGGHSHGAAAASQIAGAPIERESGDFVDIAMAPEAFIVIMDWSNEGGGLISYKSNADGLRWAADQPWIDIIHTNIQNPVPLAHGGAVSGHPMDSYPEAVAYAVSKGKLVVSAGGNFWAEPTETSPHAGPPGVLAAGANDHCGVSGGYTDFSNPNPHVVMDGDDTVAAQASGWGTQSFDGTSSASPRITGYAAQVLLEVRRAFEYMDGMRDGALVVLDDASQRPASGPLADGRLTAADIHEVIRKTADPNPHASRFDGGTGVCVPQPVDLPAAFYPKMGYGEVSEHTIDAAIAVILGERPMPDRPVEDAYYTASEAARMAFWGAP